MRERNAARMAKTHKTYRKAIDKNKMTQYCESSKLMVDQANKQNNNHHVNLFSSNAFHYILSLVLCAGCELKVVILTHLHNMIFKLRILCNQHKIGSSRISHSVPHYTISWKYSLFFSVFFEDIFIIIIIVLSWLRSVERHIDAFNIRLNVSTLSTLMPLFRCCHSF